MDGRCLASLYQRVLWMADDGGPGEHQPRIGGGPHVVRSPMPGIFNQERLVNGGISSTTMWHECVQYFSECALTRASDRLPAILGIARRIQELTKIAFFAGL